MAGEPMSDVLLEEIRRRHNRGIVLSSCYDHLRAYDDVGLLLREVFRLRGERRRRVGGVVREDGAAE